MFPYIYIVLPSYAVLAFIGAFISISFAYFRIDRAKVDFSDFLKLIGICALGGFLGSKFLFSITQIPDLITNFSFSKLLLLFPTSGFVFYGGLFGVLWALSLYVKYTANYSKTTLFYLIAPCIPLFHAFGRIGCFLAGCCYGIRPHTPIELFGLIKFYQIPVQLIESFFEFCLFVLLLLIEYKYKHVQNLLSIYMIVYAIFRFGIEFFRGDIVRGIWLGLSTAQWISIAIILYYIIKKSKYFSKAKIAITNQTLTQ